MRQQPKVYGTMVSWTLHGIQTQKLWWSHRWKPYITGSWAKYTHKHQMSEPVIIIFWINDWTDLDQMSPLSHSSQYYLDIETVQGMKPFPEALTDHSIKSASIGLVLCLPALKEPWASGYVVPKFPIQQFSYTPALRKRLVVATTTYFCERHVSLAVIVGQIKRDTL